MRANYYIGILSVLMLAGSTVNAQTADMRGYRNDDARIVNNYYSNDYDYFYTSRINRFHRSYSTFNYYAPLFTDSYWYNYGGYDPYFNNSFYYGYSPFYYNNWFSPLIFNIGFGNRWHNNYYGWGGHNHGYNDYRHDYNNYNNNYGYSSNRYSTGSGSRRDVSTNTNQSVNRSQGSFDSRNTESRVNSSVQNRRSADARNVNSNVFSGSRNAKVNSRSYSAPARSSSSSRSGSSASQGRSSSSKSASKSSGSHSSSSKGRSSGRR